MRRALRQDHWSEEEDAVIRDRYPDGGTAACSRALRGRTIDAIHSRAVDLGVRTRRTRQHALALAAVDPRPLAAALGGWTTTPVLSAAEGPEEPQP